MTEASLAAAVQSWLAQDPDPQTQAELESLSAAAATDDMAAIELADAFSQALEFGTAGLRGKLGPGPNRMNRVVVTQAAGALAAYLHAQGLTGEVVIGFDARYNSEIFARDSAEILSGAGFSVSLVDRPAPTPLIPFLIRRRGCIAGIVVTASHNPPQDNGYKVYLGDGSQIVPPADSGIAAELTRIAAGSITTLPRGTTWRALGDEEIAAYVAAAVRQTPPGPRELTWVHTALHGVGSKLMSDAAAAAGFPAPISVSEQEIPDPDFPTVDFPNPEEPGAIDLALAAAKAHGVDVVIANDPDADRCAVAIQRGGQWQMLRGDEVGALIGADFLQRGVSGTYAASIVSSTRLAQLAQAAGQPYVTTLTGFKWIGRVPGLVFGYEEALGYCCDPDTVKDKDGITAALQVLAIAARLKAEGSSIAEVLEGLDRELGVILNDQLSVRVSDLSLITAAMARLRSDPPAQLVGESVEVSDLAGGSANLPPTDGLVFTGPRVRVVVRPSGTEPKLKCYLEVCLPAQADPATARAEAVALMGQLRSDIAAQLDL